MNLTQCNQERLRQARKAEASPTTPLVKDNFFAQPVGRAVLFLNEFHHGKFLNELNRAARLCPKDVQGMASMIANVPETHENTVELVVNLLTTWANEAEAEA
tara:strand:+ start:162 stop:467 length:306 start_codon:yes stop_codon:yes gene_type:complete